MTTNAERLKYLKEKIRDLAVEIESKKLEEQYLEMAKQHIEGKFKFQPVDDDNWELMLTAEKTKNLLAYYHTLRLEAEEMTRELKSEGSLNKATKWLENKWIKRTLDATSLINLAVAIYHASSAFGLFLHGGRRFRTAYLI